MYLLLRLDRRETVGGTVTNFQESKHHVLRVDSDQNKIILEPWERFKVYCAGRHTDLFFRHLHFDRTVDFLNWAATFAEQQLDLE